MDWQAIGALAAVVSAGISIFSLFSYNQLEARVGVSAKGKKAFAFVGISASWAALVWVGVFLFEPFGPYMLDEDFKKVFAVMIALPAVLAFDFFLTDWRDVSSADKKRRSK